MNVDILAFGAHPDDVERAVGVHVLTKRVKQKHIDLTRGELGTRGSAEIREKANNAQKSWGFIQEKI